MSAGAVCRCITAIHVTLGWGVITPETGAGSSLPEPSQPQQVLQQVGQQCGLSPPWSFWRLSYSPLLNTPHPPKALYTQPGSTVSIQLLPHAFRVLPGPVPPSTSCPPCLGSCQPLTWNAAHTLPLPFNRLWGSGTSWRRNVVRGKRDTKEEQWESSHWHLQDLYY